MGRWIGGPVVRCIGGLGYSRLRPGRWIGGADFRWVLISVALSCTVGIAVGCFEG